MAEKINSTISIIIIAKNEGVRLKTCLESAKWSDEIILVDNNSSDNTVSTADQYKCKVIKCNTNNFSELRTAGQKKATSKWLLYLDADEIISSELKNEIISLINENKEPEYQVYYIKRVNFYLGNNKWPYVEQLERLFQKNALSGWIGSLHESPLCQGKIGILEYPIFHYTHRTLEEMVTKTNQWSNVEAKLRFDSNHPKIVGWRLFRVMFTEFCNSFIKQKGYQAGIVGLIESIYQSFSMFITYAKLWEMQNTNK